jgi:protein SCO1
MRPRFLVFALAVLVGFGVALAVIAIARSRAHDNFRGSSPPSGISLPDFALPDHSGEFVRSRNLLGAVVLVTFLDSQCEESCPIIASQVAAGLDRLTPEEQTDVVAIAISTDPQEDTAESVRAFLRHSRAERKLRYLVASESRLRPVWRRFGILSSAETGVDELHSAPVRIYGREGEWLATLHASADLTPANVAHDVRVALGS